jgi:hypothetical protein
VGIGAQGLGEFSRDVILTRYEPRERLEGRVQLFGPAAGVKARSVLIAAHRDLDASGGRPPK